MTDSWLAVAGWLGHTALVGGAVLLLGWVGLRAVTAPARRQRLAAWAVRAAVLAPVLCLLPAWLTVPAPAFLGEERRALSGEPESAGREEPAATEVAAADPAPGWDFELMFAPAVVADLPPAAVWQPPPALTAEIPSAPPAPEPALAPAAASTPPPFSPPPTAHHSPLAAALPLVLLAYGLVAAVLLGEMLLGHVGLMRLVRSARPASARVRAVFDGLAAGLRRRPRLLVSDRVASPVCFGLWRPTVLLPESLAKAGTEAELRWVFAHELEHVRRGDLAAGWWVGVARAVYFFLPWFWPLRREMVLAQEYLADAAAADADGRPVDYAAFLVDLSGGPARLPRMAHAVRAGRSDLFRRVTMLLQSGAGVDRRCPRGWTVLAAGGVLSAAVLLSGLGIAWADDEKPQPEKKVEKVRDQEKAEQDRADKKARLEAERAAGQDAAALKKAIAEAARKGDVDEVRRLTDQLEKALTADQPRDPLKPRPAQPDRPRAPAPPAPPAPPGFRVVPAAPGAPFRFDMPDAAQMKEAMERSEEALRKALEQLKDNPEAREAMERALKEYRKAMDEGMKRAAEAQKEAQERFREWRRANPDAQFPPGLIQLEELRKRFGEDFGRGFLEAGPRAGGVRFGVAVGPVPELLAAQFDLPEGQGVYVTEVVKGTPAEKSGLQKGDVIVSFGGKTVPASPEAFATMVARAKAGEKVDVVVVRKGKKETLKGIELPEPPKADRLLAPRADIRIPDRGVFRLPAGGFERMQVQVSNDEFTIDATRGDTRYRLTGTLEDGKPAASQIRIGEKSYKSVDEVPEEHRDTVRQLLGSVGGARR
jgi:serine protease Do